MFCRLIKIFFLVYPNGKNNSRSNPKIFSYLQIFCYLNVCHNRKNSFCSSSWLRKIHILIQSSCKLEGTPKFVLSRPPYALVPYNPWIQYTWPFCTPKPSMKIMTSDAIFWISLGIFRDYSLKIFCRNKTFLFFKIES